MEPEQIPPTVVTMNSTVRFIVEPTYRILEVTLIYPTDDEGRPGTVSVTSPLGRALLGLSVGEQAYWPLPGGTTTPIRVTDIVYQPERHEN